MAGLVAERAVAQQLRRHRRADRSFVCALKGVKEEEESGWGFLWHLVRVMAQRAKLPT